METNLEKAKRLTKDNAAIRGIDLPDTNFFYEMLELASTPDVVNKINEAIEFAEWLRTFKPLKKENGYWILESQISSDELYDVYLKDRERWRNGVYKK